MHKADPAQQGIAVIYARVSSKEQEKEGFSIPAQLKLLRGYAADHRLTVIEEFVDVETAKRSGRPGFTAMVEFFKKHGKAKSSEHIRRILLVEKTDRLYRNLKDWVTLDDLDLGDPFRQGECGTGPRLSVLREVYARHQGAHGQELHR